MIKQIKASILDFLKICIVIVALPLVNGCAHGMPVVGVCSYFGAEHFDRTSASRAIAQSEFAPEKKQQLFVAMNSGMDSDDVRVGFGINLLAIGNNDLTFWEKVQQFGLCVVDTGINSMIIKEGGEAIKDLTDSDKKETAFQPTVSIPGNGNSVNINIGTGTIKTYNSSQKD